MKKIPFVLPLLLSGLTACSSFNHPTAMIPGQTPQTFYLERKQVLSADYLLSLPEGCGADPARRWPLLLFLHGAGERGSNIWLVAKHGPLKTAAAANNFIIVSPLCPAGKKWSEDVLLALLDDIENKYPVDKHRVYLTGLSMGGFGVWNLGLNHPDRFAAIAPICGGGETIGIFLAHNYDPTTLAEMKSLGIWAFHGGKDNTVPTDESVHMVNALKQVGCEDIQLTIYPEAGHDSWTQAYAEPELFPWLLKHSR